MTNKGQCLCGTVRYEVDGPFSMMVNCHCSRCRKHHGAPFATFVAAPLSGFRWVSGQEAISTFTTDVGTRSFCSACGSVTPMLVEQMGMAMCPAGNLEGDLGIKPQTHIFAASKAPWYEITDSLPQHAGFPPEFGGGMGIEQPPVEPKPGVIQGSCLCGEVAFEIEGEPEKIYYCHCSRCRRARSAAHGCNMFFKHQQMRWVRGESLVKYFKDPNARFFSSAFCEKCGSGMPRVNFERGIAYTPASALDTDPGIRPQARIFVDSKASWVEITDQIPQFAQLPA
jgi:hypothetical protein